MSAVQQARKSEFEQAVLTSIWTGIGLVLIVPLIVSTEPLPNSIFPFIVGKALFARVSIEIIFALWLVLVLRYPAYRLPRSWLILAFGIYLGVNLLAGLFGVSFQLSLWSTYERMQGIVDLAHWFAFILVLSAVARTWSSWRILLNVNLAISLVVALLGLAEHFGLSAYIPIYRPGGNSIFENSSRLKITFGNATYVGAYTLVNSLIGLGFLVQSFLHDSRAKGPQAPARRRRQRRARSKPGEVDLVVLGWRIFWVAVVVLGIWVLVLSGTRGAAIGLVTALVAFALGYILWGQVRQIRRAALALVLVLVLLSVFVGLARNSSFIEDLSDSNAMVRRIVSMDLEESSVKSRFTTWRVGLEAFAARPLLGWGPENFIIGWGRYFEKDPEIPETFDQAHNKLVEELTTKGVLGFGSYIAIWALMAAIVIQRLRSQNERDRVFTLFIGAALIGYFVQNLFLFDTPGTVLLFFLLLGFTVFLETSAESGATQPTDRRTTAIKFSERSNSFAVPKMAWWNRAWNSMTKQRVWSLEALRTDRKQWPSLFLALAVVGLAVYYINYRPYSAATAFVNADSAPTWDERFEGYQRVIDYFPPLANQGRMFMYSRIVRGLGGMTEDEFRTAIEFVVREAQAGFESEPRNWRAYVLVASVYQRASLRDPQYLEVARSYVERAEELAPDTAEVSLLTTQQKLLEQQ